MGEYHLHYPLCPKRVLQNEYNEAHILTHPSESLQICIWCPTDSNWSTFKWRFTLGITSCLWGPCKGSWGLSFQQTEWAGYTVKRVAFMTLQLAFPLFCFNQGEWGWCHVCFDNRQNIIYSGKERDSRPLLSLSWVEIQIQKWIWTKYIMKYFKCKYRNILTTSK